MRLRALDRLLEEQRERDRRYGSADDEAEEFDRELELADRLAEQASLPPGDPSCRAEACRRLGHAAPYEWPHQPEPTRLAEGQLVRHHERDGTRVGRIVHAVDLDGLVEVDFGRDGTTLVAAGDLEPEGM
jgi:hypothetical protein